MQTSFELAVALASVPRGACRILRVESTPVDGTTRRVDGVCAEVRRKMITKHDYISLQFTGKLESL
ncbi:hypothetical protein N9L68_06550 [bacterium]|nr:hypothetical protein [bacterium]